MRRSLGSYAAVDLALAYQNRLACLIIESGVASTTRLFRRLGGVTPPAADAMERRRADGLRSLKLPVLIIHGEVDSLIPLSEATEFHELVGSLKKELLIIPDAGHNDLLYRGLELYFEAVKRLVSAGGRA